MSDRFDVLRSLLRAGADRAGRGLRRVGGVDAFRKALADFKQQRIIVRNDALTAAVAHAPGVEAATASARGGAIHVDAGFRDGTHLQLGLHPEAARFAPRGAKELVFRIEPAELCRDRRARELAGAVAAAIAQALYSMLLARETDPGAPIVDREGEERLRIDLRTLPALRRAQSKGPLALVLDVIDVHRIEVSGDSLQLHLRLPRPV